MGTIRRDFERLLERAVNALDRSATANEKLLELATAEQNVTVEAGPPTCPFCGAVNPTVTQLAVGGSGPLGEFVLVGETHCCNHTIYAVPEGLSTFTDREFAAKYVEPERREDV